MAANKYRQSNSYLQEAFEGVDLNDPEAVDRAIENQAARKAASYARQNDLIVDRHIDDDDYGLTPDKPVFVCGRQEAKEFIRSLRTLDGQELDWQFQGPVYSEQVSGSSDMYQGTTRDHELYGTVYINFYTTLIGREVMRIPEGYSSHLLDDSFTRTPLPPIERETIPEPVQERTPASEPEPVPVARPVQPRPNARVEDIGLTDSGTVFCRKCGTKLPYDSEFCFRCGTRVERPEQHMVYQKAEPFAAELPIDVQASLDQKRRREEALEEARKLAAAKLAVEDVKAPEPEPRPRRKNAFTKMKDALLGEDPESMRQYKNVKSDAGGPLPAWLITIVAIGAFALFVVMQIMTHRQDAAADNAAAKTNEVATEAVTEDPREMALPEGSASANQAVQEEPAPQPKETVQEEPATEPEEAAEPAPEEPDTPFEVGDPIAMPGHGEILHSVFSQSGFASPTYLAQPTERVIFQTDDANYYLRILTEDNMEGNENVMEIFLQAGHNYSIELPSANYRFKYASGGDAWYGNEALFGTDTQIAITDPVALTGANNNSNEFTIVLGNIPHSTVTGVNGVARFWSNQ